MAAKKSRSATKKAFVTHTAPAKKAPAKKASAKKAPAKKASAKKAPAKKAPAKKAPAKKDSAKPATAIAPVTATKKHGALRTLVKNAAIALTTLVRRAAKGSGRKASGDRESARQAGKTVDDYIAALPPAQKDAATAIRALVLETAPEASESIKWGQPVYERGGPFAYMKAAKAHLTFGFWRGTELADPDGLLQGAGDRMRHVKIIGSGLPLEAIRAFVKQAIALNAERGDPTRRG